MASATMALIGCNRKPSTAATVASTTLICDQTATAVPVGKPLRLSEGHCAVAWQTLQFSLPRTTEIIRREPGQEVWLSARGPHVDAEIRVPGRRTLRFRDVKQITQRAPAPRQDETLSISSGGETTAVPYRELKQRYRGAVAGSEANKAHEGSGTQISLCALARDYAKPESKTITVIGRDEAPVSFTAAECAAKRLVLRFSSKGEVRLRGEDGEARYLQAVTGIQL